MKLFYYKDPVGNFGDDLNPLIWYSLFPDEFSVGDQDEIALGIGTLINDRAPKAKKIYVLGSGVGYHGSAKVGSEWDFVFVRGPLSAKSLGLSNSAAITDPAILISELFPRRNSQGDSLRVSYMPHHASCTNADWREVVEAAGLQYLDPSSDVIETIHLIRNSKLVIAEAMHGAIVADALGVPWIPVKAYKHILDFKWIDWCNSMGLEYRPVILPELWDSEKFHTPSDVRKSDIKRFLISIGASGNGWTPPLNRNNRGIYFDKTVLELSKLAKQEAVFLSSELVHQSRLNQVRDRLDSFFSRVRD